MLRTLIVMSALSMAHAQSAKPLDSSTIEVRFKSLATKNEDRARVLHDLFANAGCGGEYSEFAVNGSKLPNLICVLPGESPQRFVVSAHFDNKGPGQGAVDNWTGAALLPSLYEAMRKQSHPFTFVFIAFTDEERGLFGSRDWVSRLSKEDRAEIVADINIDSIGLAGPVRIWTSRAHDLLVDAAAVVSDETGVRSTSTDIDKFGDSDSTAFRNWKIPVIDFHSLTPDRVPLLHSKQDVVAAVDMKSYYDHYRFLAAYLAYVDRTFEPARPARRR